MQTNQDFFERRTDRSEVKTRIVIKYFDAWANVIVRSLRHGDQKMAYMDLYAGPGRYNEGAASTPLLVLAKAAERPHVAERLITFFNDADQGHCRRLQEEIENSSSTQSLRTKPVVLNLEVGPDLTDRLGKVRLVPTFSFVDPCGYKGLSLEIVKHLIKDWGCDCLFFFNYRRINAALENELFREHVDSLFGTNRANSLRYRLKSLGPRQREMIIHEELAAALRESGGKFVLPFSFKDQGGVRISHSLIFVSKHEKAFEIMKEIMAKESSVADQGVPSYVYSPTEKGLSRLPFGGPLDELQDTLVSEFRGATIRMSDVYRQHHPRALFIKRNYKDALLALERAGRIETNPSKRPLNTFGDDVLITFPPYAT